MRHTAPDCSRFVPDWFPRESFGAITPHFPPIFAARRAVSSHVGTIYCQGFFYGQGFFHGQGLVRDWSGTGQELVRNWLGTGQELVRYLPGTGQEIAT